MTFTWTRTVVYLALDQALKTCNTKAKGGPDSEFLFREKDGQLFVSSLNESAEQTILIPTDDLDANEKEAFLVSGQQVTEFLKQFSEEEILCSYDNIGGVFKMSSMDQRINVAYPTSDANEFIHYNFVKQGDAFSVPGKALASALRAAAFSAASDYTLAPLTAVRLKIDGTHLSTEASDQLRISVYTAEIEDVNTPVVEYLIPRDVAKKLAPMIEAMEAVEVQPGQRHVRFSWLESSFTSSLENGIGKPFPNLARYLKGAEKGRVKIAKAELQRTLKVVGLVAKGSYVTMAIHKKGLKVVANEQGLGAAQQIATTQEQEGEAEVKLAFSYLTEAVEMITEPWLDMSFREISGSVVAAVLRQEKDGAVFEHMVFPVAPNQKDDDDSSEED